MNAPILPPAPPRLTLRFVLDALKADGNLQIFMSHLRYFKEVLAKLRDDGAAA